MIYSVFFSPRAQDDIIETIIWYNQEKENLGFEFYDQFNEKVSLLVKNPNHYSIRFKYITNSTGLTISLFDLFQNRRKKIFHSNTWCSAYK